MLVMFVENVTPSLRGEISRWMIEPKAGVFVGKVTSMVRDHLWKKCIKNAGEGFVVQIWDSNNEQGFDLRTYGVSGRKIVNHEGIYLIKYILST